MKLGIGRLFSRQRADRIPIVGFTRFSILFAEADYFIEMKGLSIDERRERLFAPVRMENRFRHFEALTLPSMIAQTDPDWYGVVLYSSELPEPWRSRLLDLLAPHPHLRAVPMAPERAQRHEIRDQMARIVSDPGALSVIFRLDDDDALSCRYIARVRELADAYPVPRTVLTFPAGHYVQALDDAAHMRLTGVKREFGIALGLAMIGEARDKWNPYRPGISHRLMDQKYPTISDSRDAMFVCSAHAHNDSGVGMGRHKLLHRAETCGVDKAREVLGQDFAHLRLDLLLSPGAGGA